MFYPRANITFITFKQLYNLNIAVNMLYINEMEKRILMNKMSSANLNMCSVTDSITKNYFIKFGV